MNFLRAGLSSFGIKLDDDANNLISNFASGGLGFALDQVSRSFNPNPPKIAPPPRPNVIKVVCLKLDCLPPLLSVLLLLTILCDKWNVRIVPECKQPLTAAILSPKCSRDCRDWKLPSVAKCLHGEKNSCFWRKICSWKCKLFLYEGSLS